MKKILLHILLTISTLSFAQRQTAIWYFGENAGLDFNLGNPVALTDGQLTTIEGCASIADYNGNLLFYTNGITVWNKNHQIMFNGDNLNGDYSSTNSAMIIPKPGDVNIYYVFTVDDVAGFGGIQYTEIDMTLGGGLGGVTNKNIPLYHRATEKITAVKHQNDTDWWVLSHKWNSNEFVAHKVTSSGISNPIITPIGLTITGPTSNTIGAIKFSPDGTKVALANSYEMNNMQLFDFNNTTGELSNPITFTGFNGTRGVYGIEFSPDSKLLYASDSEGSIYQYNTELATATEIINSRLEITNLSHETGALQMAANGKIYIALLNSGFLGVINNPNTIGNGCNIENNGVSLNGKSSQLGLPPFIQSLFWNTIEVENTCLNASTQFYLINPEASQVWNFDDPASGANNTSTQVNPTHVFTAEGDYSVTVSVTNFLGETTVTTINIHISETPTATTPTDYILCDDNSDGDSENGIIQSILLNTKDNEILGAQNPNIFEVQYFEDANYTIPINKNSEYTNTTPHTQPIYAKVFNKNNRDCFASTTFNIIISSIPIFSLEEEIIICQNRVPYFIEAENPEGNYSYVWRKEDNSIYSTNNILTINSTDDIPADGLLLTLTATGSSNLCTNFKSILLKKIIPATFTQNDVFVEYNVSGSSITIIPQDPNFDINQYDFAIGNEDGNISTYQNSTLFENISPGIKTIYIKDIYNCDISTLQVSIFGFPYFFTPNNDGNNDTWQVLGLDQNIYTVSQINIFDRFGKYIVSINPYENGWDGNYNGKKMPENDYWFLVTLTDTQGTSEIKKGHFSLIRR